MPAGVLSIGLKRILEMGRRPQPVWSHRLRLTASRYSNFRSENRLRVRTSGEGKWPAACDIEAQPTRRYRWPCVRPRMREAACGTAGDLYEARHAGRQPRLEYAHDTQPNVVDDCLCAVWQPDEEVDRCVVDIRPPGCLPRLLCRNSGERRRRARVRCPQQSRTSAD